MGYLHSPPRANPTSTLASTLTSTPHLSPHSKPRQVVDLDLERGVARVRRQDTGYYTEPREHTRVAIQVRLWLRLRLRLRLRVRLRVRLRLRLRLGLRLSLSLALTLTTRALPPAHPGEICGGRVRLRHRWRGHGCIA